MAEGPGAPTGPPSLSTWATGSFHAALLVAALVAALHLSGAAGDVLAGVGTLPGAAAYGYLWGVTVWTTGRALDAGEVTPNGDAAAPRGVIRAAVVWGAATGGLFFATLLAVAAVALLVTSGLEALATVAIVGVVGGVLSVLLGAVAGVVFALVDLALVRLVDPVVPATPPDSDAEVGR